MLKAKKYENTYLLKLKEGVHNGEIISFSIGGNWVLRVNLSSVCWVSMELDVSRLERACW